MRTPAEVVQAAFDAINLEDWGGLAELCDPVSLRLFKEEIVEQAATTFQKSGQAAPDILDDLYDDDDFDLGFIDPEECLSRELFNVTTLEQLQELDPARVFARWIQAKSRRLYRLFKPEKENWKEPDNCSPLKTAHAYTFVILGWLKDGEDLAHVMYRNDRDIPGGAVAKGSSIADEDDLLERTLCVRSFVFTALCRNQADGSWGLIASRNLYLVPSVALIDTT